jgi:hypothetical protein
LRQAVSSLHRCSLPGRGRFGVFFFLRLFFHGAAHLRARKGLVWVAFGGVGSLTCKRRARCCFLPREYGAPSTLHIISVPASRRHTHTHPHVLSSRKPYLIRPLWVVFHLLLVSVFFGSHSSTRYKTFSIIFLSRGRCTATTTRLGGGGAGMGRRGTGSGGRKDRRVMTRVGIYILYHGFTKSRRKQKNTPLFFFHFTLRG